MNNEGLFPNRNITEPGRHNKWYKKLILHI